MNAAIRSDARKLREAKAAYVERSGVCQDCKWVFPTESEFVNHVCAGTLARAVGR